MKFLQKILFPFDGPKTKFLEDKWWHRLAKVVFVLILMLSSFFVILDGVESLQYLGSPQDRILSYSEDRLFLGIMEMMKYGESSVGWLTVYEKIIVNQFKKAVEDGLSPNPEDILEVVPLMPYNVAYRVTNQSLEFMSNNSYFIDIKSGSFSMVKFTSYMLYIWNTFFILFVRILTLYLLSLFMQLIYFKGIVYIAYGNKTT